MHRDKKLGLALGVLLVGIVAAMFFRLDPSKRDFLPHLKSSRELDDRIAERRFATYPGDNNDDDADDDDSPKSKLVEPPLWEMPAFLADDNDDRPEKAPEDWLARTPAAPDPIVADAHDVDMFESGSFHGTPVPQHNKAWTVSDTKVKGPAPSSGQQQGARVHRVRNGDTLSGLAAYYLGSSGRFNEIYNLNRDVLANPNDLRVGVELKIPGTVQRPAPARPSESIFHNADGQHVVEPGEPKNGPLLQASPSSMKSSPNNGGKNRPATAPAGRFVPAGRTPFAPGRRDNPTSQNNGGASKNTLSQIPPADLPDVD